VAIDNKYGRVMTEHGNIGEDEPVFVFRAQDNLLSEILRYYTQLCWESGCPSNHLDSIDASVERIKAWQASNYTQTPESANYDKDQGWKAE
jgi:hypothetical protein